MARPNQIELPTGEVIPILYEDRSVLAVDKPRRWMLAPGTWQKTKWNLQLAITSSIRAGDFWARARGLKFLRHVHRLDADTTGILLFAKSLGGVNTYGDLFEQRTMEKVYLAVADGTPLHERWIRNDKIGVDPREWGRMKVDPANGKEAQTSFRVLARKGDRTLVEARPHTGRTHQIRVHLAASGCPVLGDELYGRGAEPSKVPLALRAVQLSYADPFTRKPVRIRADTREFLAAYGFKATDGEAVFTEVSATPRQISKAAQERTSNGTKHK